MGLLYLDAKGSYSDPAASGLKYLRADGTWAAPDASHKFLDARGSYSVPELGTAAPFLLDGIDAAKCTYANRAQNGIWMVPDWTEDGSNYAVYSDSDITLTAAADSNIFVNGGFDFYMDNGKPGSSGWSQPWVLLTRETFEAHKDIGDAFSLSEAMNTGGQKGTCCFNDPSNTTSIEFEIADKGNKQVKLAFCKATPGGYVLFDMLISNSPLT